MSNNITIELCAEDRARLDRLTAALERRACDKCVEAAMAAMSTTQQPATPDPVQKALAEVLEQAEAPAEAPVVTVEDIRARYVALVSGGKKDEARDTIKSYNVTKISDIPADKCAEVMAKLNALEG